MPFKSEAQRRLFHVKADKGEIPASTVREWEHATKNKDALPMHVEKTAYAAGARYALHKLGFVDPEDLPSYFAKRRKRQLQRLYSLNSDTGLPAGGLIGPEHAP